MRRKLGYPEVSIIILGDSNAATRNRSLIFKANTSIDRFIVDDELVALPPSKRFKFKEKRFHAFEGIVYLIDATREELIKHERIFFWEKVAWDQNTHNLPIAFCVYNSNLQGALTKGEIIENLSLIRLTDRLWNVFETPETDDLLNALEWLRKVIHMGYIKSWEEKEKLIEKLGPREIEIISESDETKDASAAKLVEST